MSREAPRFGDVFEYRSEGGAATVRIMWIAPSRARDGDWMGVQVSEGTMWFRGFVGETLQRVPLEDHGVFDDHWSEVTDE